MIEKRRSKIQGWGVFATEPIPKNKRIIHYAGEKIRNRESLEREIRYLKKGPHLVLQAQSPLRARRGRRRQHRPLHQSRLQAELLHADHRRHDLDHRRQEHPPGEELTYDYSTDGEGVHSVPLPPGLCDQTVTQLPVR